MSGVCVPRFIRRRGSILPRQSIKRAGGAEHVAAGHARLPLSSSIDDDGQGCSFEIICEPRFFCSLLLLLLKRRSGQ